MRQHYLIRRGEYLVTMWHQTREVFGYHSKQADHLYRRICQHMDKMSFMG